MEGYTPPYTITEEMLALTSEIMEDLGRLSAVQELEKLPRLRRVNRIRSIHSSLAIENNTLSLAQVTDVIEGKRVLGPQEDIRAVQNAFAAYRMLPGLDPFSLDDLKRAHGVMMDGLMKEPGVLRTESVGVINERGKVLHVAPPHDLVNELMHQLFDWLKNSRAQMLIRSSVFHYEFEFIHPFSDGNGRMGRFWQAALLASWKPVFAWIPVESIIKDRQQEYYRAIGLSTSEGRSDPFILFMLGAIREAVRALAADARDHRDHLSHQIGALMSVIESYPQTALELMEKLGLRSRTSFHKNYLQPALEAGLIGMTEPDRPTSRNQRYFKL